MARKLLVLIVLVFLVTCLKGQEKETPTRRKDDLVKETFDRRFG